MNVYWKNLHRTYEQRVQEMFSHNVNIVYKRIVEDEAIKMKM